MQLFFMFLPIVASLIILIYALKKGFDRTAFYISAAVAMVIAITANAGVMTPQASGAAVVYLSSDYLTPAEGFRYGAWVIPVFILAAMLLIYPLCGLMF